MRYVTDQNPDENIRRLGEMIRDVPVAMLTTTGPDGRLRSRPMAAQEIEFDGNLWFFTERDSGKVRDIEVNPQVNVCYANPKDDSYVSVTGSARIVDDKLRAYDVWTPVLYREWFPKGLKDPNLILIQVETESAELWDSHSPNYVELFLTGGETNERHEHRRFDVHHPDPKQTRV